MQWSGRERPVPHSGAPPIHLRRASRDALIDGVPYRQYWGEILSSSSGMAPSPASIRAAVTVKAFVNTYSLRYWTRLAPLPRGIKSAVSGLLASTGLDNVKLGVNVGNLVTAGFKRD